MELVCFLFFFFFFGIIYKIIYLWVEFFNQAIAIVQGDDCIIQYPCFALMFYFIFFLLDISYRYILMLPLEIRHPNLVSEMRNFNGFLMLSRHIQVKLILWESIAILGQLLQRYSTTQMVCSSTILLSGVFYMRS